jgi:DNA polymerase-3 subunit epsilon
VTGPAETELEKKTRASRIRASGPPIRLQDLEYVVVDVETTGGGLGHRITEIAAVRVDMHGKVLHEYATLVNPVRSIPAAITALTHITGDMVRVAPRFEEIASEVRALLDGRIFVAHNAAFDWGFISDELTRTTGRPLSGKRLCTVRLARKVVPEISRRSLDSLSYFFNVVNEARHRAFGDARATARVFRKLMDRVRDREIETWQQLEHMTLRRSQRRQRTAMPTGIEDV